MQLLYNVQLDSKRWGTKVEVDVPLFKLRLPFRSNEFVEVCSDIGVWSPGVVVAIQVKGTYKVKMDSDEFAGHFHVPSACLRRRYPPGRKVKRYKGPKEGWVAGEVSPVATAAGRPVQEVRWSDAEADGVFDGGAAQEQDFDDAASLGSGRTDVCDEAVIWNVVPIVDHGMQHVSLTPSFLVYPSRSAAALPTRSGTDRDQPISMERANPHLLMPATVGKISQRQPAMASPSIDVAAPLAPSVWSRTLGASAAAVPESTVLFSALTARFSAALASVTASPSGVAETVPAAVWVGMEPVTSQKSDETKASETSV